MNIKEIAREWLKCYNRGDAKALADFYDVKAVNDRVSQHRLEGKTAIEKHYREEFSTIRMQVEEEQIHEIAPCIIIEWKDQTGFRGCVFLEFRDNLIIHQRSYWDTLTYRQKYQLPTSIH